MEAGLSKNTASLKLRIGVVAALALLITLASSDAQAQKKGKGKKGKKAEAAATEAPTPVKEEDPAQVEARTRYANGKAAFEKGDFSTALVEFQAAYDAKPHPTVLKSVAECQVETGDIVSAISTLEKYLEDPIATGKPEVQKRLEAIKGMLATVEVTSDPSGASISLDGRPTGLTTPASIQLGAGPHTLTFDLAQHETAIRDINVSKGDMSLVAVSLTPVAPPPADGALIPYDDGAAPSPSAEKGNGPPPAFWACAALTGLGLIGGAVFGTMALNDEQKWEDTRGAQTEVKESGERNAVIADVSFGVAIASALVGTIVLVASKKKGNESVADGTTVSVLPMAQRDSVGLGALVEF